MLSFGVTVLPDPPYTRLVELFGLAEDRGFDVGWTYDSHVLWQEGFSLLAVAARETSRIRLGHCVANPGTRDPTVVASGYATLQDISDGRMVCGIGRGDSARRVIGQKPVKVDEFERSCTLIRELMNGRPVRYNETDVELKWVRPELPEIPLYVAGYGPKVLAVAGRVSDGVVIQLADPDIVEWTMGLARRAAEAAGRDPEALEPIVCAPCVVSGDLVAARDQVRWFPAMVSNHVFDLLSKYPKEELPDPLVAFVEKRQFYDYSEHSRLGAKHGSFVDDDTCDRFCILGTPEDHVAKLRRLEEIGVRHWNIYLMTDRQAETLDVYGSDIIPEFDHVAA
jgi:probable F420-dependent oxidoreductase